MPAPPHNHNPTLSEHAAAPPPLSHSNCRRPAGEPYGWPTADTAAWWAVVAARYKDLPHVFFGILNEPQANYNGAYDAQYTAAAQASAHRGGVHSHAPPVVSVRLANLLLGTPAQRDLPHAPRRCCHCCRRLW